MEQIHDKSAKLLPVGKMKGEIDSRYEAFYLAVDTDGKLYLNRDMDYGRNAYRKSERWEEITPDQLQTYESRLHFLPHRAKGQKAK